MFSHLFCFVSAADVKECVWNERDSSDIHSTYQRPPLGDGLVLLVFQENLSLVH